MNLLQRRLVCIFACFLTIAGALYATPAVGQTAANYTDDGSFSLYTYISAAESISAYASDLEPDDLEYYSYYYVEGEPTWILTGSNYADSGEGASFTSGTVPPGSTYTATFYFSVVYYYYSNSSPVYPPYCGSIVYGEGDDCEGRDNPTGYASVYVPSPPPTIDQLSPSSANQGDRNTLTITGRYLVQDSSDQLTLTFTGPNNPNNPFTLVGQPSTCNPTCTATYSYDLTNTPPGQYQIYLANSEADSEPVSFTVNISSTSGPPPDLCAVSSKQAEGFTSIVPSGINLGISGNFSVSFGGSDFAGINPTVAYGPYSTPESIAASMAALITRNYFRYGLTAKAFGRNVIYSSMPTDTDSLTLGPAANVFSGSGGSASSFLADNSPAAAAGAEMACEEAQPHTTPDAPVALVTNFRQTFAYDAGDGVLHFEYAWDSSTGNRSDLNSCQVQEQVVYPGSGLMYAYSSPPYAAVGHTRVITYPPIDASGGIARDDHGHQPFLKPYKYDQFTVTQKYRYRCSNYRSNAWNDIETGIQITRTVSLGQSGWRYDITKSGSSASINPLP